MRSACVVRIAVLSLAVPLSLATTHLVPGGAVAAEVGENPPQVAGPFRYHTPPANAVAAMRDQANFDLPSVLRMDDGTMVTVPKQWYQSRRPELVRHWTKILGKLEPTEADQAWFGDIRNVEIVDTTQRDGYTRVHLKLPIEKDFLQPHLLLLPRGQGPGPFPAVIAWTSTGPDYTRPEEWWGAWLAQRGYVVLTGWSFIRNYRGDDLVGNSQAVYERFGHWLPMAKMVHDVEREIEYLQTRTEVDATRIGFMGFSLSAKAALYVAAFAPNVCATVAIDPHVAMYGNTNYHDPWYLDWRRQFPGIRTPDYPLPELRGTVWSLLDADPARPGFERNHHEIMALAAPRALLVIAGSADQPTAVHSDDRQSIAYIRRAQEVYKLLDASERMQYVPTNGGHRATSPEIDAAWQAFLRRWLSSP